MTASKIEWTDRSDWNPIRGCSRKSPGCGGPGNHGGCYAEAIAARFSKPDQWGHGFAEMRDGKPRWTGKVELQEDRLLLPLRWRKPAKIFVSSTSDVFHEALTDEAIDKLFAVMALCPQHTFQILTKRSERMREYFTKRRFRDVHPLEDRADQINEVMNGIAPAHWCKREIYDYCEDGLPLPNVWLGVSTEDQERADERIPDLLQTPAAVRFISAEPLLGPIDLTALPLAPAGDGAPAMTINALSGLAWCGDDSVTGVIDQPDPKLDWVIVGGESGPRARPMHPDWEEALRMQCADEDVAYFRKQWGEWRVVYDRDRDDPDWRQCPKSSAPHERYVNLAGGYGFHGERVVFMRRVGRKIAGSALNGAEHQTFPKVDDRAA